MEIVVTGNLPNNCDECFLKSICDKEKNYLGVCSHLVTFASLFDEYMEDYNKWLNDPYR